MTDKGLREVVAADTQISDIDGGLGRLWYVGYDIADLAAHASYEETVYLLHHLDLPTRDQLDELNEFLIDERDLSPFLSNLMHELAQQTSPMSMQRTSISAASAYDPDFRPTPRSPTPPTSWGCSWVTSRALRMPTRWTPRSSSMPITP